MTIVKVSLTNTDKCFHCIVGDDEPFEEAERLLKRVLDHDYEDYSFKGMEIIANEMVINAWA
jgi:hypothetical protein